MTTPQHALLPCPFCGNSDVTLTDLDYCQFVMCDGCGALADSIDTLPEKTPLEVWNTRTALAQPVAAQDYAEIESNRLRGEIQQLAVLIWQQHFAKDSPGWTVLEDAYGALSQISNMVAGMTAQPRELTDEEIRAEFSKLYPKDLGLIELAENNRDFWMDALGARHHWRAFEAGAKAVLKKARAS